MSTVSTLAESITSAATQKLAKQVQELQKIGDTFTGIVEGSEDLLNLIAEREKQLAALDTQFGEETRRRQVDLDISFRENEAKKVDEVLAVQGKVAVVRDDYNTILNAYSALKTDFTKKLETEANVIRAQEVAKAAAAIKEGQLQLQVSEAQNLATINTQKNQIELLNSQIADYKAQIAADRNARVDEAKARGVSAVTVNSGK